jgi:hypothetical protein
MKTRLKWLCIFFALVLTVILGVSWLAWNLPVQENDDSQVIWEAFSKAAKTNVIANTEVRITFNTRRWGYLLRWETCLYVRGDLSEQQKASLQTLAAQIRKDFEREHGEERSIRLFFKAPNS